MQKKVLLLGIAAAGRPAAGLRDEAAASAAATAVTQRLAALPGLAQLSHERRAALIRAAIQRQAVLQQQKARKALMRMSYREAEAPSPLPATPLDTALKVLCVTCTASCNSDCQSTDSSSSGSSGQRCTMEQGGVLPLPAAAVQELLLLAVKLHSWPAVQSLCTCSVAPQLSTADAVALLQEAAKAAPAGTAPSAIEAAANAAVVSALCSLPAVQQFDTETLGGLMRQVVVDGGRCRTLVEGLSQLPAAKQLSKAEVDRLLAAAGACGSRAVLRALSVLQDV